MRTSRRRLLTQLSGVAAGLTGAGRSLAATLLPEQAPAQFFQSRRRPPLPAPPSLVYIGTDTSKPGAQGIYLTRLDKAQGQLSPPVLAAACYRPSFLAVGRPHGRPMLYVCNEADDANATLSTYQIDSATGALTLIGKVSSGGHGACYIGLDSALHSAYAADYSGSAVASYRIRPDGALEGPVDTINFRGAAFGTRGPVAARQDAPHPHCATLSPDNRFLVVCDLGSDDIVTFPVDLASARLGPPQLNACRAGSGPRHVAFHSNGRWMYALNELDNRIDQMLWNTTRGDPAHGQPGQALLTGTDHSISTLDAGFHGTNTAAEIVISGDCLYASNRGENSLAVFRIDGASGHLAPYQRVPCGGRMPRQFTIDPSAKWLLCGNQDSNSVTLFSRSPGDGRLSDVPVQTLIVPAPMMTLVI